MYAEIAELATHFSFEYIYKHDVYHSFNQSVCSFAAYMRQFVYPSRIVVILYNAELQLKEIGEREELSLWVINERFHKVEQMVYSLLIRIFTICRREEIELTHCKLVFVIEHLYTLH